MKTTLGIACTLSLSLFALGCADEQLPDEDPGEFPDGVGQQEWNPVKEYPAEVGYVPGRAIPNLSFMGFADFAQPDLAAYVQYVQMADFFNPDGLAVYQQNEFWTGARPKVVVLIMSAVWCGPCNVEARDLLPPKAQEYLPRGVQFASTLLQDNQGGPATFTDLQNWANNYLTSWDSISSPGSVYSGPVYMLGLDPTEDLLSLFDPAFPGNMVIRTSDMRIMYRAAGTAVDLPPSLTGQPADLWDVIDGILDGSITEPILEEL